MSTIFRIRDCSVVTIALGLRALNLRELRDRLLVVPGESLSHHFHESLLRPLFDDPEYRNDFATWSRRHLHDAVLAERFGVIDPTEFADLEALRGQLIDIVEDRLAEEPWLAAAAPGTEFEFLRSQMIVLDTGLSAGSPAELGALIPRLPLGAIFFHFVEGRRREPRGVDDLSVWLAHFGDATARIRERLHAIDFVLWSLSDMRAQIAAAFVEPQPGGGPS